MSVKLTEGSLDKISKGDKVFGPILQILDLRTLQQQQPSGQAHTEKFRVTLSDGINTQLAYVATQSTKLFIDRTIQQFYIVRLQEYCLSEFSNTKFIIIAKVELIQPYTSQIGNPVPVGSAPVPKADDADPAAATATTAAAATTMPPSPMKSTNRIISSPTRQGQKVFTDASATSGETITPIKSLHPYQNMWTIRARVTNKTEMKEFSRKTGTGTGKLFSVELIDEAGDEIRATAFTEVAEKLFNIFEVGHIYLISKGEVKVANKKFTTIPHPFEITFNSTTVVSPVTEDASTASIPTAHYSFVPIEKIASMEKNDLVDVLGVVTQVSDVQTFTQKTTGRDLTKRTLTLLDNTAYSIEVTLWGELAKAENIEVGSVVAIRAARVGTFNGKSLSTSASSQVRVSPDTPDAVKLATWYKENSSTSSIVPISDGSNSMGGGEGGQSRDETVKTLSAVQTEQLGMGTQPDYFTCVACITNIKHDTKISYTACPKCNSKVTAGTDGQFFCAKCNTSMPEATENYTLRMQIADATGSIWVTCFREAALHIMNNREATELIALQTGGNETEFNMAFDDAAHKWYQFRIRANLSTYHEEVRVQYGVVTAFPVDFSKESHRLLSIIDSYP